jgi:hypothetical protein
MMLYAYSLSRLIRCISAIVARLLAALRSGQRCVRRRRIGMFYQLRPISLRGSLLRDSDI